MLKNLETICKTMEFNSQICTNMEQSERLLAMGLKKETADCSWISNTSNITYKTHWRSIMGWFEDGDLPAWSLHRLIEMCNKTQFGMTIGIYNDEVTVDGDLFEVYDNTYDNLISIIEWLIGLGKFNENYLNCAE